MFIVPHRQIWIGLHHTPVLRSDHTDLIDRTVGSAGRPTGHGSIRQPLPSGPASRLSESGITRGRRACTLASFRKVLQ